MSTSSEEEMSEPSRTPAGRKRSFHDEYSSSDDDEPVSVMAAVHAAAPKRPRGRPRKVPKEVPLEKFGDYILKFQDDKTGSKFIHPTALRYTLGIVDDLAKSTTKAVAKSLRDDRETEESRNVQVRSKHHVKAITAQVREKLCDAHIPNRYVKIRDLYLNDMKDTNQRRRDGIASNEKIAKKLEHQLETLQKQYNTAKTHRDEAQDKLDAALKEMKDEVEIHPLLQNVSTSNDNPDTTGATSSSGNVQGFVLAEGSSLADWLKTVPSPYD